MRSDATDLGGAAGGTDPEPAADTLAPRTLLLSAAMHAADPTVVLSAPEAAYWDPSLLQWAAGQSWIGLLSYHAYNGGDPAPGGRAVPSSRTGHGVPRARSAPSA